MRGDPPDGIAIQERPDGGWGVFATRPFAAGDTVELAPAIVFPHGEWSHVRDIAFGAFSHDWDGGAGALALGYGSVYARSRTPNAVGVPRPAEQLLQIVAAQPTAEGAEITIADGLQQSLPGRGTIAPPQGVYWAETTTGRGRGVFATDPIPAGATVERTPVLPFPAGDWPSIEETEFGDYCFAWGEDGRAGCLPLGYGSIYNHSFSPNARYLRRLPELAMDFVALRDIEPGEEIRTNYNYEPGDLSPVWFDVVP